MTPPDDQGVPGTGPADRAAEDELRRLLAGARVDGPVPDDVARRLDAALDRELQAARREAPARTGDPAQPRRWGATLLAAAAAVAVLGGGALVAQQLRGGGESSTSADSATYAEPAPQESAGAGTGAGEGPGGDLPVIRSDHLRRDVAAAAAGVRALSGYSTGHRTGEPRAHRGEEQGDSSYSPESPSGTTSCPGPATAGGASLTVRFDGRPAALVLTPAPVAGLRTAEVWTCDGTRRLAHTTVPAGTVGQR